MAVPSDRAEIAAAVQEFIAEQIGRGKVPVSPDTRLREDLGVDGDDAADLLEACSTKFSVDLSTLHFTQHFGTEGVPMHVSAAAVAFLGLAASSVFFWPWTAVLWGLASLAIIVCTIRRQRADKPGTLRVSHLIGAAVAGRWIFPYEP